MKFPSALVACSALSLLAARPVEAREFTVLTYNVENLFDADGVAVYDDYVETGKPDGYTPAKMAGKLRTIGEVLKSVNDGRGPEVVVFNEIEMDFTPGTSVTDYAVFLEKYKDTTAQKMLTTGLNDEIRGLPSEALLLKHLEDIGLKGYQVAVGDDQPDLQAVQNTDPSAHKKAQKNAFFTRFPITAKKSHPTQDARDILEATIDVDGHPFTVFVNHWKSGAGNAETEETRRANAKTLRDRVDEILADDPSADILLAGDFNSQYNQTAVYPHMGKTGLNDVLGSQGDEAATAKATNFSLYNLWHELPPDQRGSDHFDGKWGTLMQKMITPGLYDHRGVQYVDNSFTVVVLEGVNMAGPLKLPRRWSNAGQGSGASDHFPVAARFRAVGDGDKAARLTPENPGTNDDPSEQLSVGYETLDAGKVPVLTPEVAKNAAGAVGEVFRVEAMVTSRRPLTVEAYGREFLLWSGDEDLLKRMRGFAKGDKVKFLGELGLQKGKLQFAVRSEQWLLKAPNVSLD